MGSAGLEMSMNVVPVGKGMPFLHRHQENDEVYVVLGGQGQFLVDDQCFDVAEGSVLRLAPVAEEDIPTVEAFGRHLDGGPQADATRGGAIPVVTRDPHEAKPRRVAGA